MFDEKKKMEFGDKKVDQVSFEILLLEQKSF
jgi:hypothetical protein